MSVYVMSDIHGELNKFNEMLNSINFSESDILYVLGDMIGFYRCINKVS